MEQEQGDQTSPAQPEGTGLRLVGFLLTVGQLLLQLFDLLRLHGNA